MQWLGLHLCCEAPLVDGMAGTEWDLWAYIRSRQDTDTVIHECATAQARTAQDVICDSLATLMCKVIQKAAQWLIWAGLAHLSCLCACLRL